MNRHAARQPRSSPRVFNSAPVFRVPRRATFDAITALLSSIERQISDLLPLLAEVTSDAAPPAEDSAGQPPLRDPRFSRMGSLPSGYRIPIALYYFGRFEAYSGPICLVGPGSGKGRAILQFLATRPLQRVPRDVLTETLWPDVQRHIAYNRLRVAVHHLRQAFALAGPNLKEDELILFLDGCYFINPCYEVWSDVEQFECDWERGLQLERAGRREEAIPCYLDAEALYRGDFLEEDLVEDWTLQKREQLKDIYLTMLEKLSGYWMETGNADCAMQTWKRILAQDPWREDIYRKLILYLAAHGQRANALHWYEVCVQALRERLGVEPEPETLNLYASIRAGGACAPPL